MRSLVREFKDFAVKGNMMDMAIGIVIGASFNKVIDVLVKKILLPPLTLLSKGIHLQDKRIILVDYATGTPEVSIGYGSLIEAFLDFFIIGVTLFIVVKFMNKLRMKAQDVKDTSVATPKDIQLLTDLTELIKEQNEILKNKTIN
jgi:large conductance mechanosensitive channel